MITTCGEPLDIIEATIASASNILYYNKKVYVLDDGNDPKVKSLAEKYGCEYLVRPDRNQKRYKAANLNHALGKSYGNYILTLDADTKVEPEILDDLLGHFKDDSVALVASRQRFEVSKEDFNNDNVFYEYMQTGKNADNVAISCGAGVIYRRRHLKEIGGFQEWNFVEDLYTSYTLNTHGYKTLYSNQSYTLGYAPSELAIIYKQRWGWAFDTLRLWIWKNPLFNWKLSWNARFHYFELGYIYIVSGVIIPAIYVLNIYSIFAADPILNTNAIYFVFKLPSLILLLYLYDNLGQGRSSSRMWAALFPIYFWAFVRALFFVKPKYKPTVKRSKKQIQLHLILPQLLFILAGTIGTIYHIYVYGPTLLLGVNILWFGLMIYWLIPVFEYTIRRKIVLKI
jgi:cellulose synthase (UDP-forming)